MSYEQLFGFALYLLLCNLLLAVLAAWYRRRIPRLTRERDVSREYAAMLETKFNEALGQLDAARKQLQTRLVLHGHEANPEHLRPRKYAVLVTNGYTPEGAFVVLTVSSDQPHVLPRALAALTVSIGNEQAAELAARLKEHSPLS